MSAALYGAALLAVLVGIAHSWLGERYILMRLFRRGELPRLFGDTWFTRRTLRLAWHMTTACWLGFAAVLLVLAAPPPHHHAIKLIIGATFAVHFAVALIGSRGRHLSWLVFLTISVLCFWSALS